VRFGVICMLGISYRFRLQVAGESLIACNL